MSDSTILVALILKIIKIFLYFILQAIFLRRLSRKWSNAEPIALEFFTFTFFFCMMVGSLAEVLWMNYALIFYISYGASLIFFIGFIALTSLSLGIERSANLPSKGLIALIPLTMALSTFYIDITTPPYFFIAFVVAIIPALYLHQGFRSEGLIRKQFLYIGIGYFFVFGGEALNYRIIQTHLKWLEDFWINLTGDTGEYLPPLLILLGLLFLFIGYVWIAKKLAF
ncbi:MAG: hypothetical protein ACTSRS_15885 [Candidatus Helarchaeota archaeon]